MIKQVLGVIAALVLIVAGIFGMAYGGYQMYAYFAPKYEGVRRDVMIESRYYSEATVRRLYDLKRQYEEAASLEAKQTIANSARHEASIFDKNRLPADLQNWAVIR